MKMYKLIVLLFLSVGFFMTSCEPDGFDETTTDKEVVIKVENPILNRSTPTGEGLEIGCITVSFPFQLLTINDNVVDVNGPDDIEPIFTDTVDYVIDFVYPLSVLNEDEETIVVNNIDELGELFASCIPDEGWGEEDFPAFLINFESSCYTMVYPVVLEDINGEITTVENEQEFIDALASNEVLFFQFPITIVDVEGEINIANDANSLFYLLGSCEGDTGPCDSIAFGGFLGCYEILFPISFELEDGGTVTAENLDQFNQVLLNTAAIGFSYPINLQHVETGETIVVHSDEELEEAFLACGFVQPNKDYILFLSGEGYCYTINWPMEFNFLDGTVIELNSVEEIGDNIQNIDDVKYPVILTTINDGVQHIVNSLEELFAILDAC